MYSLVRSRRLGALLLTEGPTFAAAFLVAELFYTWHSFALECAGFLATWYVFGWLWSFVVGREAATAGSSKR